MLLQTCLDLAHQGIVTHSDGAVIHMHSYYDNGITFTVIEDSLVDRASGELQIFFANFSEFLIPSMATLLSRLNSHRKMVTGHTHIICYSNNDFRLHNHCRGWTCIEKWLQNIFISYVTVTMTSNYIIIVVVELASKNGYRTYPYHMLQ